MKQSADIETEVQHINELHDSLKSIGDSVAELTYQAGLRHREIGLKLANLKSDMKKDRKWLSLFRTAKGQEQLASTLTFDYTTGRRYIQIAVLFPDEAPSFEEFKGKWRAIQAIWGNAAMLPGAEREPQQSKPDPGWKSQMSVKLSAAFEILGRKIEELPINRWTVEDCEHVIRETNQVEAIRTAAKERLAALTLDA